ncbi:MAG: hypothetical protein J3K34DRAFT_407480 [Monoraphidium minutum]|nr:MAG: hypothetical protein J3K34DRAFT_407480 [Monoraphidium minutum]
MGPARLALPACGLARCSLRSGAGGSTSARAVPAIKMPSTAFAHEAACTSDLGAPGPLNGSSGRGLVFGEGALPYGLWAGCCCHLFSACYIYRAPLLRAAPRGAARASVSIFKRHKLSCLGCPAGPSAPAPARDRKRRGQQNRFRNPRRVWYFITPRVPT